MARTLIAAWERWRADSLLPSRADIDLADVVSLLPALTVLEVRSPDVCIVRLVGSAIAAATDIELTGKNYFDLTLPQYRELRGQRIWRAAAQPCGYIGMNRHPSPGGNEQWVEFLAMPVRPAEGPTPVQFFCVAALEGDAMALPGDVDVQIAKIADAFHYLDVGGGVPADPALELGQAGA